MAPPDWWPGKDSVYVGCAIALCPAMAMCDMCSEALMRSIRAPSWVQPARPSPVHLPCSTPCWPSGTVSVSDLSPRYFSASMSVIGPWSPVRPWPWSIHIYKPVFGQGTPMPYFMHSLLAE